MKMMTMIVVSSSMSVRDNQIKVQGCLEMIEVSRKTQRAIEFRLPESMTHPIMQICKDHQIH